MVNFTKEEDYCSCAICNCTLNKDNIAIWDLPGTNKHGSIRLDSFSRKWCKKCTDKHDCIDFGD